MKHFLIFLILLISNFASAQVSGVIINSKTQEKVQFVNIWVENESIGTTSNHNREFTLTVDHSKNLIFSAIGFETRKMKSDSIQKTVALEPQIIVLSEIAVKPKKRNIELTIGRFKRSKINHYFACGSKPWIAARYFNYKEDYKPTAYLKKIRLLPKSDVNEAKFNIRLYGVSENGAPENYIYDENIIGIARKGKKFTGIDVSDFYISFPKEGLFVAIEWLIIDENKHDYKYTTVGSNEKQVGVSYKPTLGTVRRDTDENSWKFSQGKWQKMRESHDVNGRNTGKYSLLGIELTLSN
jgi:hypothetical protein